MNFTESEKDTILRAFIIYEKIMPSALRGKFFYIYGTTFKIDTINILNIKSKLNSFE